MKYTYRVVAIIAAFVCVWYLWMSKGTPPGQPPLTSLTQDNLDHFKNDFNTAGDEARLVLLLSPRGDLAYGGAIAFTLGSAGSTPVPLYLSKI